MRIARQVPRSAVHHGSSAEPVQPNSKGRDEGRWMGRGARLGSSRPFGSDLSPTRPAEGDRLTYFSGHVSSGLKTEQPQWI